MEIFFGVKLIVQKKKMRARTSVYNEVRLHAFVLKRFVGFFLSIIDRSIDHTHLKKVVGCSWK